jgi:hypothetical protein
VGEVVGEEVEGKDGGEKEGEQRDFGRIRPFIFTNDNGVWKISFEEDTNTVQVRMYEYECE